MIVHIIVSNEVFTTGIFLIVTDVIYESFLLFYGQTFKLFF